MRNHIITSSLVVLLTLLLISCSTQAHSSRSAHQTIIANDSLTFLHQSSSTSVKDLLTNVKADSIVITFVNTSPNPFTSVNLFSDRKGKPVQPYAAQTMQGCNLPPSTTNRPSSCNIPYINPYSPATVTIYGYYKSAEERHNLRECAETALQSTNATKVDTCTTEEKERATTSKIKGTIFLLCLALLLIFAILLLLKKK